VTTAAEQSVLSRITAAPTHGRSKSQSRIRDRPFDRKLLVLALPTIGFFLIPLLGWTGPFGAKMNLSGDASLLFFEYPTAWLTHTFTSLTNTVAGYNPQTQYAPFVGLLAALKFVGLNPEGVFLGFILACAYGGTAHLTTVVAGKRDVATQFAGAVGGVVMACAPLLAGVEWTAILPELLWIGLLPIMVVLFVRHQTVGGFGRPLVAALILAVTAPAISDIPGFIPVAIAAVVACAALALAKIYRFHLKRAAGFIGLCVGVGSYWLVPWLVGGLIFHNSTFGLATSSGVKASSVADISLLARQSSVLDALGLRGSLPMAVANSWAQLPEMQWSQRLALLGLVPLLVIAGAILSLMVSPKRRPDLSAAIWLTAAAAVMAELCTLGVLRGAPTVYAFVVDHVPGLDSLRGFYTVWAIPFVFTTALAVGTWAVVLLSRIRLSFALATVGLIFVAMIVYDAPFLKGEIFNQPHSALAPSSKVISGLPPDYWAILTHLAHLPPGAVLTLPLRDTAWSFVPANHKDLTGGAYLGISPIYYLTGRSEFDGTDSFNNPFDPGLPSAVANDVIDQDLEGLARASGAVGVRYVLIDSAALQHPQEMTPLIASPAEEASEFKRFVDQYAPHVIARSGPYTLRTLAAPFQQPRAFLVSSAGPIRAATYVSKLANFRSGQFTSSCLTSQAVHVVQWTKQAVVLRVPAVPKSCLLWVTVEAASGWSATIRPAGANRPNRVVSPVSETPAGIGVAIGTPAEATLVTLTYGPGVLVPFSGALSAAVLLGTIGWWFLEHRSRRADKVRGLDGRRHRPT